MCGIAGVLYSDPQRPVDPVVLRSMGQAMSHRGPDADGFLIEPGVGLVHRRLSIIDLAGGDQPIGNEDGTLQVVFNGEIYNYQELRRDLEARGHRFRTKSDTEVLVHLYEDHGERFVERLRGMFAFALWDRPRCALMLARDRVGQKPLYVYTDSEKTLFASELKPILAHPGVDRTIDPAAIEDYLALGVIPGSRSIFAKVQKLPAAHTLMLRAGRVESPRRYWQLRIEPDARTSLPEWKEQIREKIRETITSHRIADVPVGAFLSGGLDSSTIVAELAAQGGPPLTTFSIGFDESEFSELPHAREVAAHYGVRHVEEIVRPQAIGSLEDLVHHYDEPFADSSAIPTLAVSRLAAQSVKVVLSGDGGDEAFGGYARYAHDLREARWRDRLPSWLRRTLLRGLGAAWPKTDWLPRPMRLKTALTNLSLDPADAYANTLSLARLPLRRQLLSRDLRTTLNGHRPESAITSAWQNIPGDPLAGMLAADIAVLLPDDFLTKVDRASMAHGLEVRPPFVDHELLELTARLPSEFKVRHGETKWILKELMQDELPNGLARRKKQGFEIPIDRWLRGPLSGVFEETVLDPRHPVAAYLDQPTVRQLFNAHQKQSVRHGHLLWSILVLARWCDEYLPARTESQRAAQNPPSPPGLAGGEGPGVRRANGSNVSNLTPNSLATATTAHTPT